MFEIKLYNYKVDTGMGDLIISWLFYIRNIFHFKKKKFRRFSIVEWLNLIYSWAAIIFMPRNYENFIIYGLCSSGPSQKSRIMLKWHETYGLWIIVKSVCSMKTYTSSRYMYMNAHIWIATNSTIVISTITINHWNVHETNIHII